MNYWATEFESYYSPRDTSLNHGSEDKKLSAPSLNVVPNGLKNPVFAEVFAAFPG
jgi:hypothetical protein